MVRTQGSYTEDELNRIFAKGTPIAGRDENEWRKDACGHTIARSKYWHTNDDEGWEVDHMYPDGGDGMDNLRPLQVSANRAKGDKTPEEYGC